MGLPDELRILTNGHGKREQLHPIELAFQFDFATISYPLSAWFGLQKPDFI
jgi:hypothetical protein